MVRKKKEKNIPAVIYNGLVPMDYLEVREREIFDRIFVIATHGTARDQTKLKALLGLANKIRPDKKSLDLAVKSVAPYEMLLRAIEEDDDAAEKGKEQESSKQEHQGVETGGEATEAGSGDSTG